ncbi:MAG: glycerophosphodiester phosphodiesterase family protein [Halieaceae bacterium]
MIVYGHRGARGEAPENTIAGARHAVARGVRALEIDLRLSADGQLVVAHDAGLKRCTGASGKLNQLKAAELGRLDARADGPPWPNKRGTGIPGMSALYKAVPEIKHWQLELKSLGKKNNPALAAATVDWLRQHKAPAVVTSLEPDLICAVKEALPNQATGYVSTTAQPEATLAACDCDFLIAHWQTLTDRRQLRRLQARGIHISCWTVNDASVIEQLFKLGVDSVISDYPSMALPLVAALQRKR